MTKKMTKEEQAAVTERVDAIMAQVKEITLAEFLKNDPKQIAADIVACVGEAKASAIATAINTKRVYAEVIHNPAETEIVNVKVVHIPAENEQ